MAVSIRRAIQDKQAQGINERRAYYFSTIPWLGTSAAPSAPVVTVYDITKPTWVNVTSTCVSGVASVLADVVTTGLIIALTAGHNYRVEVLFVGNGNTEIMYFELLGER